MYACREPSRWNSMTTQHTKRETFYHHIIIFASRFGLVAWGACCITHTRTLVLCACTSSRQLTPTLIDPTMLHQRPRPQRPPQRPPQASHFELAQELVSRGTSSRKDAATHMPPHGIVIIMYNNHGYHPGTMHYYDIINIIHVGTIRVQTSMNVL